MFDKKIVTLGEIYKRVTGKKFDTILNALKSGEIGSKAYCIDLVAGEECIRTDNSKHLLTTEEWASNTLIIAGEKGIHLVDSQNCQAHTEITLKSSEVNRLLKITSQNGGQQAKMGPRVYAYLTVLYENNRIDLSEKPADLFTELEGKDDLWDNRGPISQNLGIAAVSDFLRDVSWLQQQLDNGCCVDDISFTDKN